MNPAPLHLAARGLTFLDVDGTPDAHRPHFAHLDDRIWPETNCYVDLWIELLHGLHLDPVPSFVCVLSADHDGPQWSFLKQSTEDIRRLYGLDVSEESVWMPVLETVEAGRSQGVLHTVEVDGWWLPDTAGTSYRSEHVKTTIVATWLDRSEKRMRYLHNAGLFELSGEDFDGVFDRLHPTPTYLPPYMERIRPVPRAKESGVLAKLVVEHLNRRPDGNPMDQLAGSVLDATEWLPRADMATFHKWAFATVRQAGATAELAADLAVHLDGIFTGTAEARDHFRSAAVSAKSLQFKMARVARGREADVVPILDDMSRSWRSAMEVIVDAVF